MKEKREELLTRMIKIYGMEHEVVIRFARFLENPKLDDELLETLVEYHEQKPYGWEED